MTEVQPNKYMRVHVEDWEAIRALLKALEWSVEHHACYWCSGGGIHCPNCGGCYRHSHHKSKKVPPGHLSGCELVRVKNIVGLP